MSSVSFQTPNLFPPPPLTSVSLEQVVQISCGRVDCSMHITSPIAHLGGKQERVATYLSTAQLDHGEQM